MSTSDDGFRSVSGPFPRVLAACAAYRNRYNEWPTDARIHPVQLHEFAQMPEERWIQFAHRLNLHADWSVGGGPLVAGPGGAVHYGEGGTDADWTHTDDVEAWLLSASTDPQW